MNIKSLLLGSAAAFVAVSGARAADAVVIAEPEPMEYVRICDTYGVGYYYIPGTETCLKVSGYIRYDIGVGDISGYTDVVDKKDAFEDGDINFNDTYYKRARFQLRVDSRTETELGTLRTYAAINFNYDTTLNNDFLRDNYQYEGEGGLTDTLDKFGIEHAYIELGGFRIGKTDSLFSTFTGYAGGVIQDTLVPYGPFGTHQIAYTFNGGNGFNAAVALEEGSGALYTLDSYVPHVVGGIGYTGGWGGISAVAGYDSVWEEWAGKVRVDFNVNDAFSLFVMGGYKSNGGDDENGNNYYGNWGGDYAIWGGGTFKANEKMAFNVQVSYDEAENFAAVANMQYTLVPNFVITPEVQYTDNFDNDLDIDSGWGGFLRFQANFGG